MIALLLLGLILSYLSGYLIILLLSAGLKNLENVALSLVLGLGMVTQIIFALDVLKISYTTGSFIFSLLIFNLILFIAAWKLKRNLLVKLDIKSLLRLLPDFWQISASEKAILCLLFFLVLSAFIKALFWPVFYWDALALYDYRARIFTEAGGIASAIPFSSLPLHIYPPMTSLAHTFVYVLGGKFANPQFIYPIFYLSLLITFYYSCREFAARKMSILFTLFLASVPLLIEFSSNAYTNVPYAFYFGMGTIYLYRFMEVKKTGLLILSGILLGLSAWTRTPTEQFFLANLLVFGFWSLKHKSYFSPIVLTLLFLMFSMPWSLYLMVILKGQPITREVTNALSAGFHIFDFGRLFTVLLLLLKSIKGIAGTSLLLALFTLLFFPRAAKKRFYLLSLLILNFLIFFLGSYAFSLSWPDWKDSIANSANRLSMIFIPIALYFSAVVFSEGSVKKVK